MISLAIFEDLRLATIIITGLKNYRTYIGSPEAHAFMLKRTEEKFQRLEQKTMEIVESKSASARDRIEAMSFARQIYRDLLSIFLFGPSSFLIKGASAAASSSVNAPSPRPPTPFELEVTKWGMNDDDDDSEPKDKDDPNRVF